ncbi:L-xylulose reductase-like [Parasteatoda tepidariorum]|uniref:L-xylulose reductase-like n=1 Tax=Parasteatoda tepidariorum TaxID=114398 RepID=UPI00077FDA6E|nr:L-xylulose reductase-like [Parasteatoda tepidariorum]
MDIRFNEKRALVTGAGKGIGRGIALKLVECGADVVAVSRTQSDLDELVQLSSKIQTLLLDVSEWDKVKNKLQNIGPIHLLVNNAAINGDYKELEDFDEEGINRMFDTNVKSIIAISQIVAKGMKDRGEGGAIVNVSSIMGLGACPTRGIYSATKGAVDQLTRSMAVEYGPYNIRVNSVNPTIIRTRMAAWAFEPGNERGSRYLARTPLGRFGEVNDVVHPILFLLSDKAAMVTGIVMPIDGGFTVYY